MKKLTRRNFIKASLLASGGVALNACTPAATQVAPEGSSGEAPAAVDPADLDLPFEIAADAINPLNVPDNITAEGVFFSGGYGHEYIQVAADLFAQVHPGSKVTVEPIQGVGEKLRPRFVGGNPPDVIDNAGAGALDIGALMSEGQLLDLGPLFKAPSLDTPGKTVEETLFPGSQAGGVIDGKQVVLNIAYTVDGIWYSSTLFEEKGWTYPTTWDEMLALCETIKGAGISPWTYQGKYPDYMFSGVLMGQIYKRAGIKPMIDIDNLVDGAWLVDPVVESVKELYTLVENGYIMPGTEGLNHTEAQAEWLKGKAVFIPSGSWLENEMKDMTPSNFKMVLGEVPGPGHAMLAEASEPYIVPSKAKNPEAGLEFLRCLISKQSAKFFAEKISSMMPVIGGTEGIQISTGLDSAVKVVEVCGENVFPFMRFGGWYNDLNKESAAKMGELLTGKITPEQYCEACQKMADQVKADPEVTKFTRNS